MTTWTRRPPSSLTVKTQQQFCVDRQRGYMRSRGAQLAENDRPRRSCSCSARAGSWNRCARLVPQRYFQDAVIPLLFQSKIVGIKPDCRIMGLMAQPAPSGLGHVQMQSKQHLLAGIARPANGYCSHVARCASQTKVTSCRDRSMSLFLGDACGMTFIYRCLLLW